MELTPKQKRFCEEYVIDFNGSAAAIRAGYSKYAAKEQAARLLTNVNAQIFISTLQKKLSDNSVVTAEMVIKELAKIGFSNIQDYIDQGNAIKDLSKIPRDVAASIKSVKKVVTEWGSGRNKGTKTSVSFEVYDKNSALEKIGRHFGIFEADNKQKTATITVNIDE